MNPNRYQVVSKQFQQLSSYFEESPTGHVLNPAGEDAVQLHALFKQATCGDATSFPSDKAQERDLRDDAWAKLKGMTIDEAKAQYVDKSLKWLQLHKDKNKEANELIIKLSKHDDNVGESDEEYSSTTAPPSNDSAESLSIDKQQQKQYPPKPEFIDIESTSRPITTTWSSQNNNPPPSSIYSGDAKPSSQLPDNLDDSSDDNDQFEEARNDSSLLPTPLKSTFQSFPHDESGGGDNNNSITARIAELEKNVERLSASAISNRRIVEIEKALERLQAEVSASHEQTEALRRDEIKKQVAKKTWTWLIKLIAKHAIINGILLIGFVLFISASPFADRIEGRSRVLEIWKYTKRLLIDWKYNYELKR
ncbi:5157_t:CDS:2 [Ambispora gerdemannii]|uniref:5157_t:CDS:1 n=1 Tax=Ambispora gerdemannii TaxID=144530 RepID=A0A9N8VPV1_9GLOM|nr:5157_t:CDS:2 [Ambispora gerdemannii]